jgi:hypothetical protein
MNFVKEDIMTVLTTKYNRDSGNLIEATIVDVITLPNNIYMLLKTYNQIVLRTSMYTLSYELLEGED